MLGCAYTICLYGRIIIIIIIIIIFWELFTSVLAESILLEYKWQQVSRTLFSILDDLENAVVSMVSTRPLISKSSTLFVNLLVTVLWAPITIGITATSCSIVFQFSSMVHVIIIYSFESFSHQVCRWFLTGVWVTTILFKSPGFFLVFWSILIIQSFGQSSLIHIFPSPPLLVLIVWWLYQAHQLQFVSLSLCSILTLDRAINQEMHLCK